MAKITGAEPIRYIDTGTFTFFGHPVPRNVADMVWQLTCEWGHPEVVWKVRGNDVVHRFTFEDKVTTETILAALVAMRMSC